MRRERCCYICDEYKQVFHKERIEGCMEYFCRSCWEKTVDELTRCVGCSGVLYLDADHKRYNTPRAFRTYWVCERCFSWSSACEGVFKALHDLGELPPIGVKNVVRVVESEDWSYGGPSTAYVRVDEWLEVVKILVKKTELCFKELIPLIEGSQSSWEHTTSSGRVRVSLVSPDEVYTPLEEVLNG